MKKGFTLAEVLITLTIIGVIAVLTIPNLMQKWEDAHTVSAVKEVYSLMDNAIKELVREEGPLDDWGWPAAASWTDAPNPNYFAQKLSNYLKVTKYCGSNSGCFPPAQNAKIKNTWGRGVYSCLDMSNSGSEFEVNRHGKMLLANGMSVSFAFPYIPVWNNEYVGYINIDINGAKGPNQFGLDYFQFPIGPNGLTLKRSGTLIDGNSIGSMLNSGLCRNKTSRGTSCGFWIIKHGNMDYKYRDVSAEW